MITTAAKFLTTVSLSKFAHFATSLSTSLITVVFIPQPIAASKVKLIIDLLVIDLFKPVRTISSFLIKSLTDFVPLAHIIKYVNQFFYTAHLRLKRPVKFTFNSLSEIDLYLER